MAFAFTPQAPNAGHQARLEAGAQRTLEAVACMPVLGSVAIALLPRSMADPPERLFTLLFLFRVKTQHLNPLQDMYRTISQTRIVLTYFSHKPDKRRECGYKLVISPHFRKEISHRNGRNKVFWLNFRRDSFSRLVEEIDSTID